MSRLTDWTTGDEAIIYQSCGSCGSRNISAARSARPAASADPVEKRASGEGTVYATSLVCRAATPETRAHVPYNIVLVDTVEGFRMMAHGDKTLPSVTRSPCALSDSPDDWSPISRRKP